MYIYIAIRSELLLEGFLGQDTVCHDLGLNMFCFRTLAVRWAVRLAFTHSMNLKSFGASNALDGTHGVQPGEG